MNEERCAKINLGGQDYDLILTMRATREIAKRFGGLDKLGEDLMKAENFEMAIDQVIWLITLLANQSIQIWNLRNPHDVKPILTEEAVELLAYPQDLSEYKDAITEALIKGTGRVIESQASDTNPPQA
jgi:hypothetical protein